MQARRVRKRPERSTLERIGEQRLVQPPSHDPGLANRKHERVPAGALTRGNAARAPPRLGARSGRSCSAPRLLPVVLGVRFPRRLFVCWLRLPACGSPPGLARSLATRRLGGPDERLQAWSQSLGVLPGQVRHGNEELVAHQFIGVLGDHRESSFGRVGPAFTGPALARGQRPIHPEGEKRLRMLDRILQSLRFAHCEVRRIAARGKGGNGDFQLVTFLPFVKAGSSGLAGRVGVEREDDSFRKSPEQAEVLLGERCPTSGHGSRQAGGEEADDVGVALADDHFAGLNDGLFGPVEAVEGALFRIDGCLGRVAVLWARPLAGAREDPAAQPDCLACRVEDREDDPTPESVPQPALALVGEPCFDEQICGGPDRPHERSAGLGCPAQGELAHGLALVAPRPQVLSCVLRVRSAQQLLVVERDRLLHDAEQRSAPFSVELVLAACVVVDCDPASRR